MTVFILCTVFEVLDFKGFLMKYSSPLRRDLALFFELAICFAIVECKLTNDVNIEVEIEDLVY